jgi:hypothetical protein
MGAAESARHRKRTRKQHIPSDARMDRLPEGAKTLIRGSEPRIHTQVRAPKKGVTYARARTRDRLRVQVRCPCERDASARDG